VIDQRLVFGDLLFATHLDRGRYIGMSLRNRAHWLAPTPPGPLSGIDRFPKLKGLRWSSWLAGRGRSDGSRSAGWSPVITNARAYEERDARTRSTEMTD
jgi:hypothetical protein